MQTKVFNPEQNSILVIFLLILTLVCYLWFTHVFKIKFIKVHYLLISDKYT